MITCMHAYMHVCICACVYIYIFGSGREVRGVPVTRAPICTHMHKYLQIRTHMHKFAHICTLMHAYAPILCMLCAACRFPRIPLNGEPEHFSEGFWQ